MQFRAQEPASLTSSLGMNDTDNVNVPSQVARPIVYSTVAVSILCMAFPIALLAEPFTSVDAYSVDLTSSAQCFRRIFFAGEAIPIFEIVIAAIVFPRGESSAARLAWFVGASLLLASAWLLWGLHTFLSVLSQFIP